MLAQTPNISQQGFFTHLLDNRCDSLDTFQLFQKTKQFVKKNQTNCYPDEVPKIKSILKRKLSQRIQFKTNNFIGLLCIYIYISNSNDKIQLDTKQFQKNFHKALLETYLCMKRQQKNRHYLIAFSTILFIMVSFIQRIQVNPDLHSFKFDQKIGESFLNFQIPDDEKLLKSYQIILLFFMKNQFMNTRQSRRLCFSSLINHIGCEHLSNNFSLVMLNFLSKHMRYYNQTQIVEEKKLISKLKFLTTTISDVRKIITVLSILGSISSTKFTIDEYMLIFMKIMQIKGTILENQSTFLKIAQKISIQKSSEEDLDKLMVFSYQNNLSSLLTLEITKKIISGISFELFLHFLSKQGNGLYGCLKEKFKNKKNRKLSALSIQIMSKVLERLKKENSLWFQSIVQEIEELMENLDQESIENHFQLLCELRVTMMSCRKEIYLH